MSDRAPHIDDLVSVTGGRRGVIIGIDSGRYSVLLIDGDKRPGDVIHIGRAEILGIIAVVLMRDPTFEDLDKP